MQSQKLHSKFYLYWQAEAIRMRESNSGELHDHAINQSVLADFDSLEERIVQRANLLAQQDNTQSNLKNWLTSAKLAIFLIWSIAFLSGIGVALSSLANNRINLASALITILGLHLVTFILWLLSYLPFVQATSTLAKIWLWLSKYLSNKNNNQAGQALLNLFNRAKAWRSAIGIISHSTWLIALTGASLSLLILLSTKQYSFHWETTILSPDDFIGLTKALGALPAIMGFPIPDANTISLSVSNQLLPQQVQAQWSVWLLGCILVWGLLPRAVALIFCTINLKHNIAKLSIDTNLPGWMELRNLFTPRHKIIGIDKPATKEAIKQQKNAIANINTAQAAIIGHELSPDTNWPPVQLPTNIYDFGTSSSRSDRKEIRNILKQHKNLHLLLVCNPDLTPDRGTIAWFDELRENATDLKILCKQGARTETWRKLLATHGFNQISNIELWLNEIQKQYKN